MHVVIIPFKGDVKSRFFDYFPAEQDYDEMISLKA